MMAIVCYVLITNVLLNNDVFIAKDYLNEYSQRSYETQENYFANSPSNL